MPTISYPELAAASMPGGATALSLVTGLAPAGGPHAGLAPAHSAHSGSQTRLIDGHPAATVIIDQKHSQLNRVESAILQSIRDEHPLLSRVPRVQVSYDSAGREPVAYTDLELPQRVFDGQILAGTVDGTPVPDDPTYRAARDSTPADARALLELSPGSLVLGAFDATRKHQPARYRSALVGEIIGVLADQNAPASQCPGVVSCSRIIRTQVLSFAVLRQLRFDSGPIGDAACRALLAAYALAGLARANAELIVRANCDLVEAGPTVVKLDARDGAFVALDPPSIEETDEVLERALEEAKREADIDWQGQVLEITGDPAGYTAAGDADGAATAAAPRPFWRPYLVGSRGH